MLAYLKLTDVGPSAALEVHFKRRLNFLTGDNGLGKTFLLDVAWWVLTQTWAREMIVPLAASRVHIKTNGFGASTFNSVPFNSATKSAAVRKATIESGYRTASRKLAETSSTFSRKQQHWSPQKRPARVPGLVIYAHVDGGFSVWDPARNQRETNGFAKATSPLSYCFRPQEVWDGLPAGQSKKTCNGLIADWASWQRENGAPFAQLTSALGSLSPSPDEPLTPGRLARIDLNDTRDQPTLTLPYQQDVPLIFASAAIKRIASLAYLVVWTWQEHLRACEIRGITPVREIVFLIDEIEAHLHPQWQRRIVKALLEVMNQLGEDDKLSVQMIATTHAPLVLASTEPYFDRKKDAIWEFDLANASVELKEFPWRRIGDVNRWLTSTIFDLREPGSLEAEEAVREARQILSVRPRPAIQEFDRIDGRLRQVLGEVDPFWTRWSQWLAEVRSER
jgi:hypothetical protein